ncbi:uncharacterized protein [Choristoneura fumiferana]|uniref:uncharacterized protein n=1 Tax=Choristoneura fumiferana TaxID=7141 RepID=UPI003D154D76
MPKYIDKKDKSISPTAAIEENLMKIMMALPKRRSSTPSTKVTQKRISDLRKSGAKTDSENDDVFVKMEGRSQVICDTPDNIIITKTAPSVEKFLRYSSSSTDDLGCDRKPAYPEACTPQKYSLIDYRKLPSASYECCKSERRDDRFSSQNVYVAGKIVSNDGEWEM